MPLDLLDAAAVHAAMRDARPDAIIHEATALSGGGFSRKLDNTFARTNLLRTAGTDALLAAARDAGVTRLVAQSFAPYRYAREGGMVKSENDPLDSDILKGTEKTFGAMAYIDRVFTESGGIALRYGGFYGAENDQLPGAVRKGLFPIIGDGGGYMSFVHLADAAAATVLALEGGEPGVYNIVDDDPAPLREWLPELAKALGAKLASSHARLDRPNHRGRERRADEHRSPGRLERQSQEGPRLDAPLPQLAAGICRHLRGQRETRRQSR